MYVKEYSKNNLSKVRKDVLELDEYQKGIKLIDLYITVKLSIKHCAYIFKCSEIDIINYLKLVNLYDENYANKKFCKICNSWIDYFNFNKDNSKADGYKLYCNKCLSDKNKNKLLKLKENNDRYSEYLERKRKSNKFYKENNKEKISEDYKIYYQQNKDKIREYHINYRKLNIDRYKEYNRKWNILNKEKRKLIIKKHCNKNKDKVNFRNSLRRIRRNHALPKWADLNKIKEFYSLAKKITIFTGTKYSVDHIIPLVGKDKNGIHVVSGLHVENNLQVIPFNENSKKNCFINLNDINNMI